MVGIFFVLSSLVINESGKYFSITFIQSIEHLHVTPTRPRWCNKKMKCRPCWCAKAILAAYSLHSWRDCLCEQSLGRGTVKPCGESRMAAFLSKFSHAQRQFHLLGKLSCLWRTPFLCKHLLMFKET